MKLARDPADAAPDGEAVAGDNGSVAPEGMGYLRHLAAGVGYTRWPCAGEA